MLPALFYGLCIWAISQWLFFLLPPFAVIFLGEGFALFTGISLFSFLLGTAYCWAWPNHPALQKAFFGLDDEKISEVIVCSMKSFFACFLLTCWTILVGNLKGFDTGGGFALKLLAGSVVFFLVLCIAIILPDFLREEKKNV